jgi:nucleotide-binding universal stress UspA family protein
MQRLHPVLDLDGFVLTEKLASGGMGAVWRATNPAFDYPLVLKIPFLDPGQDVSVVIGYEVEEMIMRRLSGPHVPRFAGAGDLSRVPFLAMEFVEGDRLADIIDSAPLPAERIASIGAEIAKALAALHRQQVSHLDLKPANVILAPRGAVLLDFGLSRHTELPDLLGEESKVPMGTGAYIAPEQVLGDRANPLSDVFALGCMLYEMATGEKPFGEPGTTAGMKRRLYQEPRPLSEVDPKLPRWLQAIVSRCLKVEPHMRYTSAESLLLDLQHPEQVSIGILDGPTKPGVSGFLSRLFRDDVTKRVAESSRRVARSERAQTVLVAVDLESGVDRLAEEVRAEAARVVAARPGSRLACLTVLKTEIIGTDKLVNAEGRSVYVSRLVALKDWAREFQRGDDAIAFHVIEAVGAASAILTYAQQNDVGHIVLGARSSSALRRHLGSVSSQVVAEAQCSVSVVRVKPLEEALQGDFTDDP